MAGWLGGWLGFSAKYSLSDAPSCKLELDRFSVQLKIQDGAECANRELTIVREGIGKIMCFSASYNLVLLSQSP